MSLADDIKTLLDADGTLTAIATGGIHVAVELSRTKTPAAFDADQELLPAILVKEEQEVPYTAVYHGNRAFVALYFYERTGTATIRAMQDRVYVLLDRKPLTGYLDVRLVNELAMLEDPALDSSFSQQRYQVTRIRPST